MEKTAFDGFRKKRVFHLESERDLCSYYNDILKTAADASNNPNDEEDNIQQPAQTPQLPQLNPTTLKPVNEEDEEENQAAFYYDEIMKEAANNTSSDTSDQNNDKDNNDDEEDEDNDNDNNKKNKSSNCDDEEENQAAFYYDEIMKEAGVLGIALDFAKAGAGQLKNAIPIIGKEGLGAAFKSLGSEGKMILSGAGGAALGAGVNSAGRKIFNKQPQNQVNVYPPAQQ